MVSLIIDNRERAIFPFLDMEIKSFLYEKKQLNTGDFLIINKPLEHFLEKSISKNEALPKHFLEKSISKNEALPKHFLEKSISKHFLEKNEALESSEYNYEIKACIERKTYTDFAASFRDGRYKSELKNMLELRKKTNCQLFFIIEGTAFPSMNRSFSRIPYVCILGAINKLMLRDNIFIIQTENEQHTARKLNELLTSYKLIIEENADVEADAATETVINVDADINVVTDADAVINVETNAETKIGGIMMNNILLTKRIQKTDEDILLKSWSSLKGISLVLGKLLMNKFTIKDLALGIITIEDIKTFKTAFGKTINKTAIESLLSIRNGNIKNCAKMLSAIVGITVDFAIKLFKIKSLKEICQYYQNATDCKFLSEILIDGKKVGPKKAHNIYTFLMCNI